MMLPGREERVMAGRFRLTKGSRLRLEEVLRKEGTKRRGRNRGEIYPGPGTPEISRRERI